MGTSTDFFHCEECGDIGHFNDGYIHCKKCYRNYCYNCSWIFFNQDLEEKIQQEEAKEYPENKIKKILKVKDCCECSKE